MQAIGKAASNAADMMTVKFEPYMDQDMIRISFRLSSQDYNLRAVNPDDLVKYPREWALYQASRPHADMEGGIPVSEVPGIRGDVDLIMMLTGKGMVTAERLAKLDDFTARMLHEAKGIDWRDTAKLMVANKPKASAPAPAPTQMTAPPAAVQHAQQRRN
jgi:hypothetical protein